MNSAILFFNASSFSAEISMSPALLLVDAVPSGFSLEPLIRSLGGAGVCAADLGPGRASSLSLRGMNPESSKSTSLQESAF